MFLTLQESSERYLASWINWNVQLPARQRANHQEPWASILMRSRATNISLTGLEDQQPMRPLTNSSGHGEFREETPRRSPLGEFGQAWIWRELAASDTHSPPSSPPGENRMRSKRRTMFATNRFPPRDANIPHTHTEYEFMLIIPGCKEEIRLFLQCGLFVFVFPRTQAGKSGHVMLADE